MNDKQTIVALCNSLPSSIGIVRISGSLSLDILKAVTNIDGQIVPRFLKYCSLTTKIKDNVLVVYYASPNSYTGEDMVEIFTHGSIVVIDCLIDEIVKLGARLACAGEFSMQAYLNQKMDLTSAEGILSLVNAQTELQAINAYKLLNGELKSKIISFQNQLINILALINADLDYPEENIKEDHNQQLKQMLLDLTTQIKDLKNTYQTGRLIKNGVKIVATGNTNVGKSSLINALLGKNRMIVSSLAGTTRDTVEDFYTFNGQKFILVDTAGIRQTNEEIENEGILRAKQAIDEADIILNITDSNQFTTNTNKINTIYVKNKCDLSQINDKNVINVSALNNINIDILKQNIYVKAFNSLKNDKNMQNNDIITDLRHYNCLNMCYNNLYEASISLDTQSIDCIAMLLNCAYEYLGQITGVVGSDNIIDQIFSNFCVGK